MVEIVLSSLALIVSVVTAWLTLFRRGQVCMTRPTMVAFTHDSEELAPKVVVRTLLYCTADRGAVVESMHATVRQGSQIANFAFWGYAEHNEGVKRGGGLFVGREGVALYHHFVALDKKERFKLSAGNVTVEIFVTMVGSTSHRQVATAEMTLTERQASLLSDKTGDVMFNLDPHENRFRGEARTVRIDMSSVLGPASPRQRVI